MLACALSFATPAWAQTTHSYSNTTSGTISGSTPCSNPLVRNFSVSDSFTVSDVDIGVLATHSWRGDIRLTLRSPAGTQVQIVNGNTNSVNGDNFNVRLNDEGTQVVNTDGNSTNHSTSAPPYQNNFIPNNALSAFDGQNSAGTWRLEICDLYTSADNGNFVRADLTLTEQPANYIDLSLTKSVSTLLPLVGGVITYTLNVTNSASATQTATNVVVRDQLPAGVLFTLASGDGSYNSTTGDWTVGSIAPGQTRTISISTLVVATAGATIVNQAEVKSADQTDLDSTPNNGITSEDDYAEATFSVGGTRTAGTPPSLTSVCSLADQILLDWGTLSWTGGSLNNNYTLTGIGSINFAISTDGTFINSTPSISGNNTGGISGEVGLYQYMEYTTRTQSATTVMTLPTAVPGLQFAIFDVDYAANDFADKITVTGTFNGATVLPTLTNGISNYVAGNVAIGDQSANNATADGNVVVTFLSPVDSVTIDYGNHSTAPSDPDGQAASIHDITFCPPQTTLSVTKISSVISDPVNGTTDPKMIPGAVVEYCILISNGGSATAANVNATDNIPGTVTYNAGTMQSGANCASAATAEDDNASGADESDPFGASISGTTLTATAASIAPSSNFALTFQVTVD